MSGQHMAIAVVFAALLLLGVANSQRPRAQGHADHHDWYRGLVTPQGYSCCNGTVDGKQGDCRPAHARPRDDGQWEAFYDGAWHLVPADRILPDRLNRVPLHAHICEQDGYVRCFLRGGGGT